MLNAKSGPNGTFFIFRDISNTAPNIRIRADPVRGLGHAHTTNTLYKLGSKLTAYGPVPCPS